MWDCSGAYLTTIYFPYPKGCFFPIRTSWNGFLFTHYYLVFIAGLLFVSLSRRKEAGDVVMTPRRRLLPPALKDRFRKLIYKGKYNIQDEKSAEWLWLCYVSPQRVIMGRSLTGLTDYLTLWLLFDWQTTCLNTWVHGSRWRLAY